MKIQKEKKKKKITGTWGGWDLFLKLKQRSFSMSSEYSRGQVLFLFDRRRPSQEVANKGGKVNWVHPVAACGCQAKEFKLYSIGDRKPLIVFEHEW